MITCKINNKNYYCEYQQVEDGFEVQTSYYISEEDSEETNGINFVSSSTSYKNRDIYIYDPSNKSYFLLKDAYWNGTSTNYSYQFGKTETRFKSLYALSSNHIESLLALKAKFKVKKIRIYSPTILDFIKLKHSKEIFDGLEYTIKFNSQKKSINTSINKNNIHSIKLEDDYNYFHTKDNKINIELKAYIELTLIKGIDYTDVSEYVRELIIYMQLYIPGKVKIDDINIFVGKTYYKLIYPFILPKEVNCYVRPSVNQDLKQYLCNCYTNMPYRENDTIRGLHYLLIDKSRNIEDNFLMCYRFIEHYYKKYKNSSQPFLDAFADYPNNSINNIPKYVRELKALRNHYTHDGYYIKDNNLLIRQNKKSNYIIHIDFYWIKEKYDTLLNLVINIVFKNILNYDKYNFNSSIKL